ncbi:uncharacterized protein LOC134193352 [Corticium candelabrum]|uniref:uncharacterized protein LOC134193352 n=1 Tax=Corticium candelabrum TaxID=121492 RepID=UPI002E258DEE|nr:uncharacterized protein LOC134193352 [Corticium candelabrum]
MKSSDVAVYGVTAQPQEEADKAVTQLRLHYKTYGDPDHKLATHLKDKGLLDVIIARQGDSRHPKVKDYKDGMAQPAVVVVNREGAVLYSFIVTPGLSNAYGATGRPNPKEVCQLIQAKLSGSTENVKMPSKYGVFKF